LNPTTNAKAAPTSIQNPYLPAKYLMPAHSQQPEVDISNAVWYLGIDFGTTGISAVLLNHTTAQRYPIYWSNELRISREELQTVNPQLKVRSSGEVIFRLPTVTYSGQAASNLFVQLQVAPIVVGSLASSLAKSSQEFSSRTLNRI
jgi:activator of 2-hydroxyglutaryl-CoA dehydratase